MSFAAEIYQLAHDGKLEELKLKLQGRPELISSKDSVWCYYFWQLSFIQL